jgi:hypothetical protein
MKEHVTFEHGDAWARWKNVNLNLATKDDRCQEKSKHRSIVGYGAIIDLFGRTTPYKKEGFISCQKKRNTTNWHPKRKIIDK